MAILSIYMVKYIALEVEYSRIAVGVVGYFEAGDWLLFGNERTNIHHHYVNKGNVTKVAAVWGRNIEYCRKLQYFSLYLLFL